MYVQLIASDIGHGVQATYCLFILVSIFSLVIGYYDIIKNVPLFRKVGLHQMHMLPLMSVSTMVQQAETVCCHTTVL